MRISHLSITNFEGLESFQVALPPVALISGDNGTGKSSLLDAIKFTYGKGHNPDVIRTGAEVAEVIITHDDGSQVKARASNKTNETIRGWKAAGAKRFIVSREQIDAIANAVSYDPLAFLAKSEKDQLATLLEIMPPKVDVDELAAAIGEAKEEALAARIDGLNGLDTIRVIEKAIYDARTARNTAAKTQEAHAAELEAALPPPSPEGGKWEAEAARLAREIKISQDHLAGDIAELGEMLQSTKDRETKIAHDEEAAADAEYAQALADIEKRRADRKATAAKKAADAIEAARSIANREASRIKAEIQPQIDALKDQETTARERARSEVQAEATRKAAGVAKQHAAEERSRSEVLTGALERLAALKASVASRLPIPGITFEDGRILDAKGVPLCKWNEESRIRFSLRVATLAHGAAGFIVLDGSNGIVGAKWDGVLRTAKKYAEQEGLQFVIARAEAGKQLTVEEVK